MNADETNLPVELTSFIPSPIATNNNSKISDDPQMVKTHFICLSPPNDKGQARYKCITCGHEFECSGRRRLIDHIIGPLTVASKPKNGGKSSTKSKRNVRECTAPYQPLKDALICYMKAQEELPFWVHARTQKTEDLTINTPSNYYFARSDSSELKLATVSADAAENNNKNFGNKRKREISTLSSANQSDNTDGIRTSHPFLPVDLVNSKERLISLFHLMYGISPQVVQSAVMLELISQDRTGRIREDIQELQGLFTQFNTSFPTPPFGPLLAPQFAMPVPTSSTSSTLLPTQKPFLRPENTTASSSLDTDSFQRLDSLKSDSLDLNRQISSDSSDAVQSLFALANPARRDDTSILVSQDSIDLEEER